jgi:hypothetical protein
MLQATTRLINQRFPIKRAARKFPDIPNYYRDFLEHQRDFSSNISSNGHFVPSHLKSSFSSGIYESESRIFRTESIRNKQQQQILVEKQHKGL